MRLKNDGLRVFLKLNYYFLIFIFVCAFFFVMFFLLLLFLQELNVSHCLNITDKGMLYITDNCPCLFIMDVWVAAVAIKCMIGWERDLSKHRLWLNSDS